MGSNLNKLIFQPPECSYLEDKNLIKLSTRTDQTIRAFYVNREAPLTILFSHANAEDLGMIVSSLREVAVLLNVNVFAYEYSGYGLSTGEPSEENMRSDIEAAFKYVRDSLNIPWQEIVVFGRSVGTGPSCFLAAKTAVRGVILQSPMLSILRVAFPLRYTLPRLDVFSNIDIIAQVRAPCFIVHGTRDEIVPFRHGLELSQRAKHAYNPFWVDGGAHNNMEIICYNEFYAHIKDFLDYLMATSPSNDLLHQAATNLI